MADKPVKIGIMSFAHMHAYSYACCLKNLPDVEFEGIADEDAERAQKMAETFGVKAFASYEEMLETDVDAVIVCSENVKHKGLVIAAAEHGKNVMCEKPLATTVQDAQAMIEACKANNVQLMTAFPCRYHPAFTRLKAAVDAGRLGTVLAINATNQGTCPGGWFIDTELSGGGAVMDHTVHVLDLIRCLTGAEPVRVYAEVGDKKFNGGFDDSGIVTVDFSNGMFATIDCSWSRPKSAPFWGNVKMAVTGTGGIADMDMFAQKIDLVSDITSSFTYQYWGDDMDLAMVSSFVQSVKAGTKVDVAGEDGAKAVQVVQAAYEAARTGKPVDIN